MNPGHIENDVFKHPSNVNVQLESASNQNGSQYGYAPNPAVQAHSASLPSTPPQASPPDILNSNDMLPLQFSNLMSRHLLSTTPSSRGNASGVCIPGFPTTAQSGQPLLQVSLPNSLHRTEGSSTPIHAQFLPNHLPNGFTPTDSMTSEQQTSRPTPKKTKKRRRKSESSDGSGAFSAPLDGSPRLIKKIGRVIQTVESERDLDIKVDAMLKNIMDKVHKKQSDPNAVPAFSDLPSPMTTPEAFVVNQQQQPPQLQKQQHAEGASVGSPHNQVLTKPTPKRRSRAKKKVVVDHETPLQLSSTSASAFVSPALSLPEQYHQQQHQPQPSNSQIPHTMFQFPINMTNSEAIAVASIAALGERSALDQQARLAYGNNASVSHAPPPTAQTLQPIKQNAVLDGHVPASTNTSQSVNEASRRMLLDASLSFLATGNKIAPPPYTDPPVPQTHELPLEKQQTIAQNTKGDPFSANTPFLLTAEASSGAISNLSANTTTAVASELHGATVKSKQQRARKRRRSSEKLSDHDIGKIVTLLKMANAQYFGEFINQLQAFAMGKNPDWMTQYPNIAHLMGLNRDSKDRAKQILEYMRQQTGLLDAPEPTASAKSAGVTMSDLTQTTAPVQMNGGERLQEGSFMESYQSFLHTTNQPTVSPGACVPSPAKASRRQQRSRSQAHDGVDSTAQPQQHLPPDPQLLQQQESTSTAQRRGSVGTEPPARTYPRVQRDWALFGIKSALISDGDDDKSGLSKSTILSLLKDQSIVERLKCNAINHVEEICKCDCVKTGASHPVTCKSVSRIRFQLDAQSCLCLQYILL